MQESLQLPPSDDEAIQVTSTSGKKPPCKKPPTQLNSPIDLPRISKWRHTNNDSQESLQYSICNQQNLFVATYKEDTHRSPKVINIPLLELDKDRQKYEAIKIIRTEMDKQNKQFQNLHRARTRSPSAYDPAHLNQQDQRKTMENRNSDTLKLVKRNKQLEHALQLETMLSEELRSRLAVLKESFQQKMVQSGLAEWLNLRNSQPNKMSNVDIFLELKKIQQSYQQIERDLFRVREQNDRLTKNIMQRTGQLQKANKKLKNLEQEAQQMERKLRLATNNDNQERESLANYIEQLKSEYSTLLTKNQEIEKRLQKLALEKEQLLKKSQQAKQSKIEESTNKFINLLNAKDAIIEKLQKQLRSISEEYEEEISQRDWILHEMEQKIQSCQCRNMAVNPTEHTSTSTTPYKKIDRSAQKSATPKVVTSTPTKHDVSVGMTALKSNTKSQNRMIDRLKIQIASWKEECEYYKGESKKRMADTTELHALRLRYQTEMQYLREKIGGCGQCRIFLSAAWPIAP